MHHRVDNYLNTYKILYKNQYGFRKGHSCEHALMSAQNKILENLDKKQITLLLLIDFSKAFDMVDHDILLYKLNHYGIRGIALKWFESYLKNRKQYAHVNNVSSKIEDLKYGVPQGSILGPLLFIIYINDLPNIQKLSQFVIYADDANIFITGATMDEIETKFNELAQFLVDWVSANGLLLNVKKTNYMIFANITTRDFDAKIKNIPIEHSKVSRFLGVLIDSNLTWRHHIAALQARLTRNAGILLKMKGTLPIQVLKTLYHSFIHSHMNHCPLIWGLGKKSTVNTLFVAQKRAMRTLVPGFVNYYFDKNTGEHPCHTKPIFTELKIQTIHNVILQHLLVFMRKVIYEISPPSITKLFTVENSTSAILTTFQSVDARLKPHNNSIFVKGPKLYNLIVSQLQCMPDTNRNTPIFSAQIKPFKNYIKSRILVLQASGNAHEWADTNFGLYKGSRRSTRISNQNAFFT